MILDAYSRRVIGWALDRTLEDQLTLAALRTALARRSIEPGLVHHSHRGSQYASHDYTDLLKASGIEISMSRTGNPWDKAYASYCTSCKPQTMFSIRRRRFSSLTPCAFRGRLGPGSSYSQSSSSSGSRRCHRPPSLAAKRGLHAEDSCGGRLQSPGHFLEDVGFSSYCSQGM